MTSVDHAGKERLAAVPRKGWPFVRARLVLAAILLFLCLWIVLPPPTYVALGLAVGAPELSAWLLLGAGVVLVLGVLGGGRPLMRRFTVAMATAAFMLAATPFIRFPATFRRFDAIMRGTFGDDYLAGVAPATRGAMRPQPLSVSEMFTGLRSGASTVLRGVPFAEHGGVPLTLDVYRPPTGGSHPAVLQIYGGAWRSGAPGKDAAFAAYLASHGYVVFAIDYRHAPRWRWPAQAADVRAALDWIREKGHDYGADPGRLALVGRSSGAQLAMVAAYAADAPPVRAVVDYYGPVSLADAYHHPPHPDPLDVRAVDRDFIGGAPEDAPDRYRSASPLAYAVRPQPATLLVYAARDKVVEPRFGILLRNRLCAAGTSVALLEIPWAGHAFDIITGGPSAQIALYYTERFLAFALAPAPPSPPPCRPLHLE